eukprot:5921937-Amphidinium_carterae.1
MFCCHPGTGNGSCATLHALSPSMKLLPRCHTAGAPSLVSVYGCICRMLHTDRMTNTSSSK